MILGGFCLIGTCDFFKQFANPFVFRISQQRIVLLYSNKYGAIPAKLFRKVGLAHSHAASLCANIITVPNLHSFCLSLLIGESPLGEHPIRLYHAVGTLSTYCNLKCFRIVIHQTVNTF